MESLDPASTEPFRRRRQPLPERYYLEHFHELLTFVAAHYAAVLDGSAKTFINEFGELSLDEQSLYVRLTSRRGRVFRPSSLTYREIDDRAAALDGLLARGWLSAPTARHLDDILALLKRGEILAWLRRHVPGVGRSLRKADYVAMVREHCDHEQFVADVAAGQLVAQAHTDTVGFLAFLYFGDEAAGLSAFTMRDLGLIRARRPTDEYEPRFVDVDEAKSAYFFASTLSDVSCERASPATTTHPTAWPPAIGAAAARARDRLALYVGRTAERQGAEEMALAAYASGESGDCLTGRVRLLIAAGDRAGAERTVDAALADPRSDDEYAVAADLKARKFGGRRTSARTDFLRESAVIDADSALLGCPEQAVIRHFARHDIAAVRVENRLWRSLFGLVFWDTLHSAAAHSPFDALPAALADGTFAVRYADAVTAALKRCEDRAGLIRDVTRVAVAHFNTPNGVFRWRADTLERVVELIRCAPDGAAAHVLAAMARDFSGLRHGWPDLLVRRGSTLEFVEVKAEGDQLRRSQWQRLTLLQAAGFAVSVVRVRWTVDPAQTFVVVDVETTGGRGEHHRITEFGAVRVRGGQVVDRYQTLLHPQRAIPPTIARLTGITEAMVATAPTFADVADRIADFLDGAIFVAHNVAFDYRFVRQEFARLGRQFRAPKLCTCAGMRRFFPGHASYSLGALCAEYDIPLRQHHRALCDAQAAAELLFLINDRRAEILRSGSGDSAW